MSKSVLAIGLVGILLVLVYGLLDPSVLPFPKCPFLMLTGWQCPGCGSQRAIHHALQGDFYQSFRFNLMFLPALLYALIGYGIAYFFPLHWPEIRARYYGVEAAWLVFWLIIIYWIVRNIV